MNKERDHRFDGMLGTLVMILCLRSLFISPHHRVDYLWIVAVVEVIRWYTWFLREGPITQLQYNATTAYDLLLGYCLYWEPEGYALLLLLSLAPAVLVIASGIAMYNRFQPDTPVRWRLHDVGYSYRHLIAYYFLLAFLLAHYFKSGNILVWTLLLPVVVPVLSTLGLGLYARLRYAPVPSPAYRSTMRIDALEP